MESERRFAAPSAFLARPSSLRDMAAAATSLMEKQATAGCDREAVSGELADSFRATMQQPMSPHERFDTDMSGVPHRRL